MNAKITTKLIPTLAAEILYDGVNVSIMDDHYLSSKDVPKSLPNGMVQNIITLFEEHGYDVSDVAIKHNYNAWYCDMKSGFRDEKRGVFLFTPCGCNRLCFRASRLRDEYSDWQTTYKC